MQSRKNMQLQPFFRSFTTEKPFFKKEFNSPLFSPENFAPPHLLGPQRQLPVVGAHEPAAPRTAVDHPFAGFSGRLKPVDSQPVARRDAPVTSGSIDSATLQRPIKMRRGSGGGLLVERESRVEERLYS